MLKFIQHNSPLQLVSRQFKYSKIGDVVHFLFRKLCEYPNKYYRTGKVSYNIDWSLIDFYLSLGHAVIFDSPCLYEEMVEKGISLSKKYNVKYKYVECYVDDIEEIRFRLTNRERMISQIKDIQCHGDFYYTINNSKKPLQHKCLKVNSGQPLENYIQEVMDYTKE